MTKGVICANCGKIVKEICSYCWKCPDCCDCGKFDRIKEKSQSKGRRYALS